MSLDLSHRKLTDDNLSDLLSRSNLTQLTLWHNFVTDRGAQLLAQHATLTSLDLGLNRITVEGTRFLAQSSTLTRLCLSEEKVGDDGARALALNTHLSDLNLNYNELTDAGIGALAQNTALRQLSVGGNRLTDRAAKDPGPEQLADVSGALLRSDYGRGCARSLIERNAEIAVVGLQHSDGQRSQGARREQHAHGAEPRSTVSENGAKALARNTALTYLNLTWNKIRRDGRTGTSPEFDIDVSGTRLA